MFVSLISERLRFGGSSSSFPRDFIGRHPRVGPETMILTPLAALALAFFPSGILAGSVQLPNIQLPSSAAANKAAVVDIFTRSYDGYR